MDVNSSQVNEEKSLNEEIVINSEDALNQVEKLEVSEKEELSDVIEAPETVTESVVEVNVETVVENNVETVEADKSEVSVEEESVAPEVSEPEVKDTVTTKVQKSEFDELVFHPIELEDEPEEDIDENSVIDDSSAVLPSIEEIVQKLRELLEQENPQRKDVDEWKNFFYRSLRNESEQQKASFLESGGEEIDFIATESPFFVEGKELLSKIKEKRAHISANQEVEKEKNVTLKLGIIDQIRGLIENQTSADFNVTYQEFRNLQQQWNDIKLIPIARTNELWKSYQHYVEKFYDLVRINNELREYDFKKNLEKKVELSVAAEKLDEETDVISAFHQLQSLHQQWREIGPVARKDREDIWNRFKEASANINKKYQDHFEKIKDLENENLELKITLCEKLEAIDYTQLTTIKAWNSKVKDVMNTQEQWRQIGYVPKKFNTKVYDRYRAACDFFFRHKSEFFKSKYDEMESNYKKKLELCERAEALKDSIDWQKTSQEMINIQKDWKSIGAIPYKFVDSTWKRFIAACDHFFEQKKNSVSSQHNEEIQNLEKKKIIIEQIINLNPEISVEEAMPMLQVLIEEFHQIGYVPFKQKDRIYKDFHAATDAQFQRLNIDKADQKLVNFRSSISEIAKNENTKGQLYREREKLMRQFDRMKSELHTYQNNIGFLTVSSKKGNSLVDDMNQKIEKLKVDLDFIVKKIDTIDKEL